MIEVSYDNATNEELLDHLLRIYSRLIFTFPKTDCQLKIKEVYDELKHHLELHKEIKNLKDSMVY